MSKRYFYTDALAAAWMAKHFGMRFASLDNVLHPDGWRDTLNEIPSQRLLDHDWPPPSLGRFYIMPNRLHSLDVRAGDGVEFDRWHWERQREESMKDAPPSPHLGTVIAFKNQRPDGGAWLQIISAGIGWDDNYSGEFNMPFKIIRRDCKPFMWPEEEAA